MSDNYVRIFVVLVCFWTFLIVFTHAFSDQLKESQLTLERMSRYTPSGNPFQTNQNFFTDLLKAVTNWVERIPVVGVFVPLYRIMTFQYGVVPAYLSIFLDLTLILSGFVVYRMVRG